MKQLYSDLLDRLENELHQLDNTDQDPIEIIPKNIKICLKLNKELKKRYIQANHNKEEQIRFFKTIKPLFYSELFYQRCILKFYKSQPEGTTKVIKAHIHKNLERSNAPFYEFSVFHNYMRMNSTQMDETYFIPIPYDPEIHDHLEVSTETDFSSPADTTLSILIATKRHQEFLKQQLAALKTTKSQPTEQLPKPLKFKGSKVDLILTSYALSELSDAEGDVKRHAEWLSLMYDQDLGDVYRGFHDIKKKKNPTAFFDKLKKAVFRRMDGDNDEE